jgi:hypothetical protein
MAASTSATGSEKTQADGSNTTRYQWRQLCRAWMDGWLFHGDARVPHAVVFSTGGSRGRETGCQAGAQGRGRQAGRGRQPHKPGWLVAPARRHPFLCFLLCKNSTAAPPLPRFRALTKHTKRDRESRQRQESPISSCPAQRALMPLPFGLL